MSGLGSVTSFDGCSWASKGDHKNTVKQTLNTPTIASIDAVIELYACTVREFWSGHWTRKANHLTVFGSLRCKE